LKEKYFQFIKNYNELIEHASIENREVRIKALKLIEKGLKAADPERAVKNHLKIIGKKLIINGHIFEIDKFNGIYVIGAGKASGKMAKAVEEILSDHINSGIVIVPKGLEIKVKKIKLIEGDHPIPSRINVKGAIEIVRLIEEAEKNSLIISLISGGGSALLTLPAENITLEEISEITQQLLRSGADIREINTVRKHLSQVKGGQLARKIYPRQLISLIISDVVGDPIDMIASGPTAPDPTTFRDAYNILRKYGLWEKVSQNIRKRIERGISCEIMETPKKDDITFTKVLNVIIASNLTALKAIKKEAQKNGLNTIILSSQIEGEARHVGKFFSSIVKEVKNSCNPIKPPASIIGGGETTVKVVGNGLGGRNQELALSAAISIEGLKGIAIVAVGSDGIDGITDAAGAIVDGETIIKAKKSGLDPTQYLRNNDSYTFFKKLGGSLIYTGVTGTNVNDFILGIIEDK